MELLSIDIRSIWILSYVQGGISGKNVKIPSYLSHGTEYHI
jgi:hypothetical protein